MPIAAALPYVAAATSIYTVLNATKTGMRDVAMNAPPPPPIQAPPKLNSPEVEGAGFNAMNRARAAIGSTQNIATSPLGIAGGASTTGKTLLGM